MNLLADLQAEQHTSYVFISHDMGVVRYLADRIAVMYLGRIVEVAATDELFAQPTHPYTEGLLAAVPVPDPTSHVDDDQLLSGDVPLASAPPGGCAFHPRCSYAIERCRSEQPLLDESGDKQHPAACFCPLTGAQ